MNLDNLYSKFSAPQSLSENDIDLFKDLSIKYPYAQLFSIFYLKALSANKDIRFEEELSKHAFKITDRAKLYELIHAEATPHTEEVSMEETTTHESEEHTVEEIVSDLEEIVEVESPVAPEPPIQQENLKQRDEDLLELEKEILASIVASSYSLEKEEERFEKKQEDAAEGQRQETLIPSKNEARSFTDWLSSGDTETSSKTKNDDFVQRFIAGDKEEIKQESKTPFYSASKKAKESVSEESLIYSETLANIFALQGNYPKAIAAFQQLMLTIPEKKRYFAQKIEELNKKINT